MRKILQVDFMSVFISQPIISQNVKRALQIYIIAIDVTQITYFTVPSR